MEPPTRKYVHQPVQHRYSVGGFKFKPEPEDHRKPNWFRRLRCRWGKHSLAVAANLDLYCRYCPYRYNAMKEARAKSLSIMEAACNNIAEPLAGTLKLSGMVEATIHGTPDEIAAGVARAFVAGRNPYA